jgi:dimethylamine monooxygenase subunit A
MNASGPALTDLFPEGDFRLHLTLRRGEPADFFRVPPEAESVLAERARWIEENPQRTTALTSEGVPLLNEFAALATEWGARPVTSIADLGRAFDCDILLLSPDAEGEFRLRGGALCFPTGWALEEKMGRTMDEIHGVVPGLNPALGAPIRQFLSRLKPGVAFQRDNWGLAATNELNLHPARGIPPPQPPVVLDRLWLRVEHQALVALPQSRGVVFGIRIALHRLDHVARSAAASGLRRALATMPPELAVYKRIDLIRNDVVSRL